MFFDGQRKRVALSCGTIVLVARRRAEDPDDVAGLADAFSSASTSGAESTDQSESSESEAAGESWDTSVELHDIRAESRARAATGHASYNVEVGMWEPLHRSLSSFRHRPVVCPQHS